MRKQIFQLNSMLEYMSPEFNEEANMNEVFEEFNKQLQVSIDKKNKELVQVSFETHDADVAARLVNDFVVMAANKTVADLFANAELQINNMKENIRNAIEGKRSLAKQKRLDRMALLKEALLIAKKLNIVDTSQMQSFVNSNGAADSLYLIGETALTAELMVLRDRKNDDSFIDGLRELQERLAVLEGINIILNKDEVFAARIDQKAMVPEKPIKPNKLLVVLISILLGFFAGVLLAFLKAGLMRVSGLLRE